MTRRTAAEQKSSSTAAGPWGPETPGRQHGERCRSVRSAAFTEGNMTEAVSASDTDLRRPLVLVTGVEQPEGAHIARVLYGMGYHVVAHSFSGECADRVATDLDDTGQRVCTSAKPSTWASW